MSTRATSRSSTQATDGVMSTVTAHSESRQRTSLLMFILVLIAALVGPRPPEPVIAGAATSTYEGSVERALTPVRSPPERCRRHLGRHAAEVGGSGEGGGHAHGTEHCRQAGGGLDVETG